MIRVSFPDLIDLNAPIKQVFGLPMQGNSGYSLPTSFPQLFWITKDRYGNEQLCTMSLYGVPQVSLTYLDANQQEVTITAVDFEHTAGKLSKTDGDRRWHPATRPH